MTAPVTLVTGASKGIGAAAVQRFLEAQYQVFNLSRSANPDSRVRSIATDLASAEFVPALRAALLPELAGADSICLIHNAALYTRDTVENLDAAAFADRARAEIEAYRQICPEMSAGVEIRDDVPGLMVAHGKLLIGQRTRVARSRAEAAVQHEVGTHLVTYVNAGA